MGPLTIDAEYLDEREGLYFLEALTMFQQQSTDPETPHEESIAMLLHISLVAARAAYDVKHAKEKNARRQYKSGMRDVVTVTQSALDYAGDWKKWEERRDKSAKRQETTVHDAALSSEVHEETAIASEVPVAPMGTTEISEGFTALSGPPTPVDVLSDPPNHSVETAEIPEGVTALSGPPTPVGVLSDPPNQTASLSDSDMPAHLGSHRISDVDVLDAALARIRATPVSLHNCSPRKRSPADSPKPAAKTRKLDLSPPLPHKKPARTPLPTFSTPGFGKIRAPALTRTT